MAENMKENMIDEVEIDDLDIEEENTEVEDAIEENSENSEDKPEEDIQEIPLNEVVEKCSQYLANEISQREFAEWAKKIKIASYLPLLDKMSCLSYLLFKASFDEDEDPEWQIFALEQYKFWDVLLKYTNIKTEGYEEEKNLNNYDTVFSALGDYIVVNCYNDYNRIIQMFESTMNIYNIKNLLQTFANFGEENFAKSNEELNKELKTLAKHKGTIDTLAEILINRPSK